MFLKKLTSCILLFFFFILATQSLYSQKNVIPANLNKQNNFFIENKGQWDKQVKFLARLSGLNAWIMDDGIVFDFFKIERKETTTKDSDLFPFHHSMPDTNFSIKGHVIKMIFPETINPGIVGTFEGKFKQEAYYNYFIGNDSTKWASFVGLFTEVYITNITEGIDMRLYFDGGKLRYDFVIKPNGNIDNLVLKTEGSDGINISDSNELVFKTSLGDIINNKVFVYQENENIKTEIGCGYRLAGNDGFGFDAANYDHGKKLVIDPFIYSTYLGGTGNDYGYGIAIDATGCSYITGFTGSSDFPTSNGAYQKILPGYPASAFVTKFNRDLSAIYFSTFLGGNSGSVGNSIAVDNSRNVLIIGVTESTNFPVTSGVFQDSNHGNYDCFITKLNITGSGLIYSSYLGGRNDEVGFGSDRSPVINIDKAGNIWVAGATQSKDFPVTQFAFQKKCWGQNGFICKFNSTLTTLLFSSFIGGNNVTDIASMGIDNNGNVYVGGSTKQYFPTTIGAFIKTTTVLNPSYISKIDSSGNLIYSTFICGTGFGTDIYDIAVDQYGNVYGTGLTDSTFPVTFGAFKTIAHTNTHGISFAFKLNATGSGLVYSTFISDSSRMHSIAVDTFGNTFISGFAETKYFPVTLNAYKRNKGMYDWITFTILNNTGSGLIYSTYIGSGFPYSSILDNNYTIYTTGMAADSSFPVSANAYQKNFIGKNTDAFVIKMNPVANIIYLGKITGSPYCYGDTINVHFTSLYPLWTGNVFFAQLSDSDGSFNNPINIGSLSSLNSGVIIATIPKVNKYSKYYRIRVIATEPYIISDVASPFFTINPSAIANFNKNSLLQCSYDKSYIFFNSSSISRGKVISYNWNFGDSTFGSSIKDTIHTYHSFGTYKVRLIAVSDSGCSDTLINYISVFHKPKASLKIADTVQCFNENNFHFTDNSVSYNGNIRYLWQFGDRDTSSLNNPVHLYDSFSNNYFPKLIITDSLGCKDTSTRHIYILPSPSAGFKSADTVQCVKSSAFHLTDTSIISNGYISIRNWSFGDGTFDTGISIIHHYLVNDTFKVSLIATSDKGCSDTAFGYLYTLKNPSAEFIIDDTSQCLYGNSFSFTPVSTDFGDRFRWYFGDGKSDMSKSPTHSYLNADTFSVKFLVINNSGCMDSMRKMIMVNSEPQAGFTVNDFIQCKNNNLFVFKTKKKQLNNYYDWNFGDGNTSNIGDSLSHFYNAVSTYTVKLIMTNQFNCKDSSQYQVFILPSPKADFSINDTSQCLKVNYFDFINLSDNLATTYEWYFGDGNNSSLFKPNHVYSSSGIFNIKLRVSSKDNCPDSMIKSIFVDPGPVAPAATSNSPVCIGNELKLFADSTTGTSFKWYSANGFSSALRYPVINNTDFYDAGFYYVKTYENGCESDSSAVKVVINPLPKVDLGKDISISPGGSIFLDAGNFESYVWQDNSNHRKFLVTSPGIYFVIVTDYNGCRNTDSIQISEALPSTIFIPDAFTPNGDGLNDQFVIVTNNLMHFEIRIFDHWGENIFHSTDPSISWDGTYKGSDCPVGTYTYMIYTTDNDAIIRNFQGIVNLLR